MKKYRIINKEARNTNQELKEYTFEELKSYFEPNKEMWDEEVYDEWHPKWEKIKDLYDLEEYLKEEADGMAVPYVFEEVNVKNSKDMIGLRIREARKRVPYKQKELADIMGVTQKDISRWESGYCVPSTENIIKLAGILKTSTDELLKTDDDGVVRYDLYRNTLQTRNPMKIYEGCTVSESCDQYPDKIKSFTDKETALDELWRCYKSDVKEIRAFGGYIIYEVTEYYVEENTYDEDGEFKDGGDIVDFAPLPVKNDKDLHELAVMLLAYCGIIDDEMSEEEQWEAVKANEEHDFLSHIRGRDGYNYLWYADKNKNAAINIRTGEITDNADFIKNHLF